MITKSVFLIVFVLVLISGSFRVDAAITPPEVVNIPYTTETINGDLYEIANLSTALVGKAEIPLISYVKTESPTYLIWVHLATAAVPGNIGPGDRWKWDSDYVTIQVPGSLSNVATEIYGPDTFGMAWAYDSNNGVIAGFKREQKHEMTKVGISSETLIQISKFGDAVVGAPSIELIGGHYRMAVVIKRWVDSFNIYKLIYLSYVGGNNTSCSNVQTGYKCEVIDTQVLLPISSPSLAYAGGDAGIAYVKVDAVHYAFPYAGIPANRPANCGPENSEGQPTWRCIEITAPSENADRVELAFGSDSDHAAIVYNNGISVSSQLWRATYTGYDGNCGIDGVDSINNPVYRWVCQVVDAQIENIDLTTYSVTFDPNDYPVISWNNKMEGDDAYRLWIAYPRSRLGQGDGWYKQLVDGNDWSYTGTHNDISINSAGLTFLGYIQPWYQACGEPTCIRDNRDRLKAAMQWFEISMPLIAK